MDSPIELDLGLEVEAATGQIDADRINSAGDFVDHFIPDELPQSAIDNTEGRGPFATTFIATIPAYTLWKAFISRLINMELPKSDIDVKQKKSDFSSKQKARRETIRDKMEKRKEESRIRIEAQKAAREEERKRHGGNKRLFQS